MGYRKCNASILGFKAKQQLRWATRKNKMWSFDKGHLNPRNELVTETQMSIAYPRAVIKLCMLWDKTKQWCIPLPTGLWRRAPLEPWHWSSPFQSFVRRLSKSGLVVRTCTWRPAKWTASKSRRSSSSKAALWKWRCSTYSPSTTAPGSPWSAVQHSCNWINKCSGQSAGTTPGCNQESE